MGMNLYVHTRTMKIVPLRRTPASGPLRGTAGREFFKFLFTGPLRGRPVGGGSNHRIQNGNNPRFISEYYDFHGKCSMKIRIGNIKYFGFISLVSGQDFMPKSISLFANLLIQTFMNRFQVGSIHLDHLAIICHQAIDLTFHIRCLRIDRSRKALFNQWTKVVQ